MMPTENSNSRTAPVGFLDACCLVSLLKRELCLAFAAEGLCGLFWSPKVLDEAEWAVARMLAVREGYAEAEASARAADLRRELETAWPDAMVTGGTDAAGCRAQVKDEGDQHVVASALAAGATWIVTENLRDFPRRKLAAVGLGVTNADGFLAMLVDAAPHRAAEAVEAVRQRLEGSVLRNPFPVALAQAGLKSLANRMKQVLPPAGSR